MWDYKTDYHVLWIRIQLGDCDGDMADNLYSEKHFQGNCKKGLDDRYVVQIFYNIFGYPDVPVHSVFCQSKQK